MARFIDKDAEFLYVPAAEVLKVAEETGAVPYDIPGVQYGHDGELCSFDAFLKLHNLSDQALQNLALMVRGADTGRSELAPQCPGLLAMSLGLSTMYQDDHEMLKQGMVMYDAFYAWLKHARGETHNWPTTQTSVKQPPS